MYDVVIVGYGPTGMLAAILLGRAGRRVCVLERYRTLYNLPRVGIVHDDVLRMFQEIGITERIRPATTFLPVYELANGETILLSSRVSESATHGWPEYTSIYQPAFEAELDRAAKALPCVDVRQGEAVVALAQDADKVTVTAEGGGGTRTVEGRFVIGADGGNSFVRAALGIAYEDLGFKQDWLVVDARAIRPNPSLPAYRQFCEVAQPCMTLQMGPEYRRWSFMIFPGESPEDAVKPENVWKRLDRPAGAAPGEFELIRVVAYNFRSLIAERWREGRVFLAGDAAHQMPPYLAQGLCSGFRDAHNIAWKLDLVLGAKAAPALLDSYFDEREPNARATVMESMRVGQNVIERDPDKARKRDAALMALQAELDKGGKPLIAFRVPGFAAGFIATGASGAGEAFVQGHVRGGVREGLFDDVVGTGFVLIARGTVPALSSEDRAFWAGLGGRIARLGEGALDDIDGALGGQLDALACDALIKRPDNTIYGACRGAELPALMAGLRARLEAA
jgi:2-polyprenyl-6-methoxyphenol hydroxylase-like FAD-dependent oxidoreductase